MPQAPSLSLSVGTWQGQSRPAGIGRAANVSPQRATCARHLAKRAVHPHVADGQPRPGPRVEAEHVARAVVEHHTVGRWQHRRRRGRRAERVHRRCGRLRRRAEVDDRAAQAAPVEHRDGDRTDAAEVGEELDAAAGGEDALAGDRAQVHQLEQRRRLRQPRQQLLVAVDEQKVEPVERGDAVLCLRDLGGVPSARGRGRQVLCQLRVPPEQELDLLVRAHRVLERVLDVLDKLLGRPPRRARLVRRHDEDARHAASLHRWLALRS